jgi:nitrate reductase assembly molybdenum cofactor insertion protein NarJ
MDSHIAFRRAQVYAFLSGAFPYPLENWSEDSALLPTILADLNLSIAEPTFIANDLASLQYAHRHSFGLAGSLCYETEYGLPHEFRQSQELADISGFYHAFGFRVGGARKERPDHLAVELEFMYALALKQAYALDTGALEQAEICLEAQCRFLQDHLGHWVRLFERSLAANGGVEPYLSLAHFMTDFVQADEEALGVRRQGKNVDLTAEIPLQHTPFDPDFSCAGCALAGAEAPAEVTSHVQA